MRRKLGIGPGSVLEWEEQGEAVIVRRAGRYTSEDVHRALFPQGVTTRRTLGELKAATSVEMLLSHKTLTVQDSEVVSAALGHFRKRPALGFSDCMLFEIARKAGHLPLGTFDRNLGKLPDTQRP